MKKLKVKKIFIIIPICLLIIGIASFIGYKVYEDAQYKKTNEYKLLNVGYTIEEIQLIEDNLNQDQINELFSQEKDEFLLELFNAKYYLKKNLERYVSYHEDNLSSDADMIISIVNTNNDYDYYEHNLQTDTSQDNLLLVNKFYQLSEDYEPEDLVEVSNRYYYGDNHQVRAELYENFLNLWTAAYNEGYYLIINSSYRSYQEQEAVYQDYKKQLGQNGADKLAARPGYSEHQTGLSIDVFSKDYTTTSNFKNSPPHLWLKENAYKYGFIERYPEGKEYITGFSEEAWHWRYVGREAATYIHNNDITFDEYYAYFVEK